MASLAPAQTGPEGQIDTGYAFGSARYAWTVLLILCGLQFVSNMERQILGLVVEPLRRDFHILDIDVSLLQGFAFALFYSVVAIPIGWLADRWWRTRIIMLGMLLWALSTIGCMVAQSYSMLFCARLMIGLADASLVPASFSLLSDYFPKAKLAGAVGMATGATFLGTGASLSIGGLVLGVLPMEQTLTLPFGLGIMHGWQWLFGIMSVPGLLLLLAMFAVREPPRRDSGDARVAETKLGPGAILRYFRANAYYLGPLIAGLVLLGAYQYGVTAWAVTLFIRRYGWTATQIGLLYGLYFMIIGSVASIVGGRLADYLRRRGRSDANFLVPLGAVITLTPLAIVFALSANAMLSAALLGAITFLSVMSFGPAMAGIPAFVDSSLRAQFIALTMMLSTLLGSGGGPWLVAFFTQAVFHDPLALPWSLAICAGLLLIPCGLCFLLGARSARMPRHPG